MVALLRYADFAEVARALGTTSSAVGKWYWGKNVGAAQLLQVEVLLGTQRNAAQDVPERLDKIERYLRVMARGLPVPAAVLAEIEAAHHDVSGGAPEPPPPGAARRKGGRRPRGK